jgi:protein-disulfide isomerase
VTRWPWIPLVLLLGCDIEERLGGVERVTQTLEEGVVDANEEAETLRADLTAAKTRADQADEDRKALEERVSSLEKALERVEAKVDAPPLPSPEEKPTVAAGRPDPAERYKVPVGDSASRGKDDAKVTLVMITDFQCPFCKRVQPTIRALERRYGDELRIVVKHNPLPMHTRALAAAQAAEAARKQDKFWELHDLLYDNNRALSDADLRTWAKKAGCDVSRFESDLRDSAATRRIDDDIALARRVGARGTPSFFINGRYLAGALPQSKFETVIDEELVEADRQIASGVAPGKLYESLMHTARTGV